jgi:hypothetical protein
MFVSRGLWRGLRAVSACALLAGCGWFSDPVPLGKARPGADRAIAPTGTLPADHQGRSAEQGVTPADETRSTAPQIGTVVKDSGGQRAQKEAADKAAAERDAKAREQRAAAERDAKAREQRKADEPPAAPAAPAAPEAVPDAPKS